MAETAKQPLQVLAIGTVRQVFARMVHFVAPKKESDHVPYGDGDTLPVQILDMLQQNGTARRAAGRRARYIMAKGLQDSTIMDAKAGAQSSYTVGDLLAEGAKALSKFEGFALAIHRNIGGEIIKIEPLPWAHLRANADESRYFVNENFGTGQFKKSETVACLPYKPVQDMAALAALQTDVNKGKATFEVARFYHSDDISTLYPVPEWYSEEVDVRTGIELRALDLETAVNGFMPSAILTVVGRYDDVTKDADGQTPYSKLMARLRKFTGLVKNADGTSDRSKLLVLNAASQDELPKLDTFDVEKIISGSIEKRDANDRQVCRAFGMSPVLLGFSDAAVLGNEQAMANASAELANDVEADQELLQNGLYDVLVKGKVVATQDRNSWRLTRFVPANHLTARQSQAMSLQETRTLAGLSDIADDSMTEEDKLLLHRLASLPQSLADKVIDALPAETLLRLAGVTQNTGGDGGTA